MKYCTYCGSELRDDQDVCYMCGKAVQGSKMTHSYDTDSDIDGFGWGILGFLIPLAGLALYLIWNKERPKTARIAGLGALVSVIVTTALFVLYVIVVILMLENSNA